MNWVKLPVDLAREAMSMDTAPRQENQQPPDLAAALAQQFAVIERNMDSIVTSINAHNAKLERALAQQRIWNYLLLAGLVIVLAVSLLW